MRAAVFEDIKKIVFREDYPKPSPEPSDAIVKVYYCGICGSDVTNFKQKLYQVPLIMGHEFVGEIVELGENITDFKVGDTVLGINVQLELTKDELSGLGIFIDGGFAEYVRVPKNFLFKAPDSIPLQDCALIESFAFALRALKLSRVKSNQNIVIIGAGTVGLTTLTVLLRERDPNYLIVVEPHEFLREKAKEFGATEAFPPMRRKLRNFFNEKGPPSHIFECAGSEKAFKFALDLIKRGGTITVEGIYRGTVSFPLMVLNSKEICLQGVISHDKDDIHEAIELVAQKRVNPNKLISEIVPLKEIQKAFEKFLKPGERKFIKILVKL